MEKSMSIYLKSRDRQNTAPGTGHSGERCSHRTSRENTSCPTSRMKSYCSKSMMVTSRAPALNGLGGDTRRQKKCCPDKRNQASIDICDTLTLVPTVRPEPWKSNQPQFQPSLLFICFLDSLGSSLLKCYTHKLSTHPSHITGETDFWQNCMATPPRHYREEKNLLK